MFGSNTKVRDSQHPPIIFKMMEAGLKLPKPGCGINQGNKRIGWKFVLKLINVWYGIRACWVEKFVKIN